MSRLTDEQTMQVRINTAVSEALSANNAKWREKIEALQGEWACVGDTYCPTWVLDLRYILSEMGKEGE